MSQEFLFGSMKSEPQFKEKSDLSVKTEIDVLSVSEISQQLKRTVEVNFSNIRIRGEVSQPKYHGSGHLYCRLKDENTVIDTVCWRGIVAKIPFKFEDGMEVICRGRLTTYPGRSQYQIVIDSAELAGEGALLKMIEMRTQAFMKEGLFDEDRKKPLPYLPKTIGMITSPTGAVIKDVLHRIQDRFPVHVLLWPVAVQGIGAELQIADAIDGFNELDGSNAPKPDLLIVARGGGSLEDLMPFNEEIVVRATANSEIPIISAVGHETDTTLIDFASDRRAPTPTAAAEMAVPVKEELSLTLVHQYQRMRSSMYRLLVNRREYVDALSKGIKNPQYILDGMVQRLDDWSDRLNHTVLNGIKQKSHGLEKLNLKLSPDQYLYKVGQSKKNLERSAKQMHVSIINLLKNAQQGLGHQKQLLESYSYKNVLKRGYAIVKDKGQVVSHKADAEQARGLSIEFQDGEFKVSKIGSSLKKKSDQKSFDL